MMNMMYILTVYHIFCIYIYIYVHNTKIIISYHINIYIYILIIHVLYVLYKPTQVIAMGCHGPQETGFHGKDSVGIAVIQRHPGDHPGIIPEISWDRSFQNRHPSSGGFCRVT